MDRTVLLESIALTARHASILRTEHRRTHTTDVRIALAGAERELDSLLADLETMPRLWPDVMPDLITQEGGEW